MICTFKYLNGIIVINYMTMKFVFLFLRSWNIVNYLPQILQGPYVETISHTKIMIELMCGRIV